MDKQVPFIPFILSYILGILIFRRYKEEKRDALRFSMLISNAELASFFPPCRPAVRQRSWQQSITVIMNWALKYVFVSHFESDECGGLSLILKHFPEIKTICSEVTARQLSGFGITNDIIIKKPGEKLISTGYELEFINYPSEMHLWEGLLPMENKRGIFFSSDLVFRFGKAAGTVIEGKWQSEIDSITPQQAPDPDRRAKLQQTLEQFHPKFVAAGHGACLKF